MALYLCVVSTEGRHGQELRDCWTLGWSFLQTHVDDVPDLLQIRWSGISDYKKGSCG